MVNPIGRSLSMTVRSTLTVIEDFGFSFFVMDTGSATFSALAPIRDLPDGRALGRSAIVPTMESTVMEQCPVDEPVVVTYGAFECLGYLDKEGIWHDWFSNKELRNVTKWTLLA